MGGDHHVGPPFEHLDLCAQGPGGPSQVRGGDHVEHGFRARRHLDGKAAVLRGLLVQHLLRLELVLALAGEPRAEGATRVPPAALGRVLGLDRAPEVKTIRRKLGELAAAGKAGPESFVLPSLTLALNASGIIARMTRAGMIDVLAQDYVRTARAKGLREAPVVLRHALANALIPTITVLGLQYGYLIAGAAITETVFAWPGLGRLMVDSIGFRDYPVIQAGTLIVGLGFIVINLVADLGYAAVDPRVRYG